MASQSSSSDFFDEIRTWSEIKLRILVKYIDAYLRHRGGFNQRIYYVDGFAGPGYYGQTTTDRQEGSPIRITRAAQQLINEGRHYSLIGLYSEQNASRCNQLRKALEEFEPALSEVFCGSFQNHLPTILTKINSYPTIFFLDPFGVKDIPLRSFTPLLKRNDTELLINFNTRRLWQLAGFEDSNAPDAAAKRRLVSDVLGDDPDDPEWIQQWRAQGGNARSWERWAVTRYGQRICEGSPYLRFTVDYPIRETYGGIPKYYLIFATRHPKAVEVMNDLLCTEEEVIFSKTSRSASQLNFLTSIHESIQAHELEKLLEDIHSFGLAHQGCNREVLIRHFIFERFGQFKKKHYRQALDELISRQRMRIGPFNTGEKDKAPMTFL